LKQKIEFKSLSYLDGSDLITKSKGPMIKMDKKNFDAQYVYSETEGNQLLINTFKYFNNFDSVFDWTFLDMMIFTIHLHQNHIYQNMIMQID
jgi:hypothetical protein